MSQMRAILLLVTISAMLGGCKKEEIVVDELTTNPFDTDYSGPSIFTRIAERTVPYTIGTNTYIRLEVDVRVNTNDFPGQTAYSVLYRLPTGSNVNVGPVELQDNEFTMIALDVQSSAEYCFLPRLSTNGAVGGGNIICGIAD